MLAAMFNTEGFMKSMLLGKLGGLMLVAVLLVFGLGQITDVVQDRRVRHMNAVSSVSQSLAGSQTLLGPLVQMVCTEEWKNDKLTQRREFTHVLPPSNLVVGGTSQVEARARGLHATQVFTLKSRITAQWADLKALEGGRLHAGSSVQCAPPVLLLAVSDARGIRQAEIQVNGQPLTVQAGTGHATYTRGVQAGLPAIANLSAPMSAEIVLELMGTEGLNVVPLGSATQIQLTSNWPHPSFYGQFLPSERTISDKGFDASWRVSALASTAQQAVLNGSPLCNSGNAPHEDYRETYRGQDAATAVGKAACVETLGVGFFDPVNTYALSDRATKYGLLFIVLTFVAVGLFEFMRGLRVHPIQYLLVGAAISIFFLLLVSLSEHLAFGAAYSTAASSCVVLLGYYASHMLHSWKRGLPFASGIAALYGLLYVLLQLEQTALVVGAIALFIVLGTVMGLTRKVDWYARLQVG